VAPKKTKKPVSLSWTTISRSSGSGAKKTAEKLEVPYLTNATSKANKAFNAGVSRAVASWRGEVAPLPGADCNEVGMCPLAMDRIDGGIYEQRYASALTSIYVWTGGAHGLTDSFGLTVDLQTGDSVGLDTFVKAPDSVVNAAVGRALLNKLPADETQGQTPNVDIRQDGVAWSVSDKGVSFAFAEGLVASNAQGLVSVTVPWNEVQG
jgi:hypothetical protein